MYIITIFYLSEVVQCPEYGMEGAAGQRPEGGEGEKRYNDQAEMPEMDYESEGESYPTASSVIPFLDQVT